MNYDRIIEINSIKMIVHQDIRLNRRNLIYNSNEFNKYIENIDKNVDEITYSTEVYKLFNKYKNELNDIEIKIAGYF